MYKFTKIYMDILGFTVGGKNENRLEEGCGNRDCGRTFLMHHGVSMFFSHFVATHLNLINLFMDVWGRYVGNQYEAQMIYNYYH